MKKACAIATVLVLTALIFGCGTKTQPEKRADATDVPAAVEPTAEPTPEPTAEPVAEPTQTLTPELITKRIKTGETRNLDFGGYKWRALDVQDDKALLITEDIIALRAYGPADEQATWETCALRAYLNGAFYDAFLPDDRGLIIETAIANPGNLWFSTKGGNDTTDRIFLLSLEEADRYFGNSGNYKNQQNRMAWNEEKGRHVDSKGWYLTNDYDSDRAATYNGEAVWWWLRSPGDAGDRAACVGLGGWIEVGGFAVGSEDTGVRPALWLSLG